MLFKRILPCEQLKRFIECFWIVESQDETPVVQKIIPDGYPEVIFHYHQPYRININGFWEQQSKSLIAGQIKQHFFLENTGRCGVFGIKFKPAALTHLFDILMHELSDKVIPITELNNTVLNELQLKMESVKDYDEMLAIAEKHLQDYVETLKEDNEVIDKAVELVFTSNGDLSVSEISSRLFISERVLQRMFQKYIGLPPKIYARIIRFNYIFELMQQGKESWLEVTYHSGYFDQSHFIRDFKSFTGEDPSAYQFKEKNLSNFFLNKK